MKIKKLSFLMLMLSTSAFADNAVTLNKVTLFLHGAELEGQSTVSVAKGENEIVLSGVANDIDPSSINVGFLQSAAPIILSTTLKNDFLVKKQDSPELVALKDKLKQLKDKYQVTEIEFNAITETVSLLKGNRIDKLIRNNADATTDMKNMLEFVKSQLVSSLTEQARLQSSLDELKKQIMQYQAQIEHEHPPLEQTQNVIVVKVHSDKEQTLPLSVSYVTEQAGWTPVYDVRVNDINSPLQLTYKADVYQRTGLDWQNIEFTLSTANPSEGITSPRLNPWRIDLYNKKSAVALGNDKLKKELNYVQADSLATERYLSKPLTSNINVTHSGISTKFDIKLPHTIKSNSDNNVLTLQDKKVVAAYRYISVPKLDSNAFLQAQIEDWDKLDLLPGKSTVFVAGNYVGESFLTTQDAKETLNLSLGRDKTIIINRHLDLNQTSRPSFLANEVSQKYAYTISAKNTKTLPVDLVIYDQLPVIDNKTIGLEDAKYEGASYEVDSGLLTWNLTLKPSENKDLNFSFKLTYPKDKMSSIIGL